VGFNLPHARDETKKSLVLKGKRRGEMRNYAGWSEGGISVNLEKLERGKISLWTNSICLKLRREGKTRHGEVKTKGWVG